MVVVETEADARDVDERFNGFHDGFIKEVFLRSHDSFSRVGPAITDIAHDLTGAFDAVLLVAHYNYGNGLQSHQRAVRCTFRDVKDFCLDLREVRAEEWPIKAMEIHASKPASGDEDGPRFSLVVFWGKLVSGSWSVQEHRLLTFRSAEFEEV